MGQAFDREAQLAKRNTHRVGEVFVVRLGATRPFTSGLSVWSACILFLYLRWHSCFAMLRTSNYGRIWRATQQMLGVFQQMESGISQSARASTQQ
jgi:hypothetical protein